MKQVVYRTIDEQGRTVAMNTGTVDQLLWAMPSFPAALAANGGVPPLEKLNRMLSLTRDTDVGGAGVMWVPLQVTPEEYLDLAERLTADPRVQRHAGTPAAVADVAPAHVIDPLDLTLSGGLE